MDKLPVVKDAITFELKKRETKAIKKYHQARKAYNELLNHV